MRSAAFTLECPATVAEAQAALSAAGGTACPLAGGQSLLAQLTRRELEVDRVVDLGGIAELRETRMTDTTLRLGAMVTVATLNESPEIAATWPLLAESAGHVGHRPIRIRSTVGGALAFADPPAEVPLALMVLGATVEVIGLDGVPRVVPVGAAYAPGDLITAITVPAVPGGAGFFEVSRRMNDRAIAVAAALIEPSGRLRLGLAAGETPATVVVREQFDPAEDLEELVSGAHARAPDWFTAQALLESARRAVAEAMVHDA